MPFHPFGTRVPFIRSMGLNDLSFLSGSCIIAIKKLYVVLLSLPFYPNTYTQYDSLPTKDVYDRFDARQKRLILAILSVTGLVPMFVSGSFVPSIPQISSDLDSTPAAVSLGVSLSVFASSFGVMFWSAYTSFYGRRAMYLCGFPFTILASFGVAASTDINSLLFWRFVQTFGCSGSHALGAATIGDIYEVEERGTAMGTFIGATLFGLAIAPPVGGAFAQYLSWRGFQATLGVFSVFMMLLLFFFFPETAHPGSRGIDQVQHEKKLFVWINPFRCISFLRSPNIMAVALANSFAIMSDYALLIPIAYTVGTRYGITNEGLIGALFLPNGLGNFVGSMIAGRISDHVVRRQKAKRNGIWVPEDRLRAVWLGGLVLVPLSLIISGFTTAYVGGTIGLAINLLCFFTNGVGVDLVLTPIGAYTIDIIPARSAELMAVISAFRSLLLTPVSALIVPSVETIGVAATNSLFGILALFGYFLTWLTIRYGAQMRACVDVGYPDFDSLAKDDDGTIMLS